MRILVKENATTDEKKRRQNLSKELLDGQLDLLNGKGSPIERKRTRRVVQQYGEVFGYETFIGMPYIEPDSFHPKEVKNGLEWSKRSIL